MSFLGRLARGCKPAWTRAAAGARILKSDVPDIVFHFAVEEYLMNFAKISAPLLYLWRPQPVVTIGRHQNPWKECVLSRLEEDAVQLVRRRSGGGAVFQDQGCSVFTFIFPSQDFNIDQNLETVLGALRRLGVDAEKKGRNDLTYEGKKISGSAFKHAPDRQVSLHHGTILIDTDLTALQRYLTPDKRKLEAKGIASVGARVMNLRESFSQLKHEDFCEALAEEFRAREGETGPLEEITEGSELCRESAFQELMAGMKDKSWVLGRTPEFSHNFETRIDGVGIFDVHLKVVHGVIEDATIFSDALFPDVISESMEVLKGSAYGRQGIASALASLDFKEEGPRRTLEALAEWMVSNVDD